jgi:hypothetical protein
MMMKRGLRRLGRRFGKGSKILRKDNRRDMWKKEEEMVILWSFRSVKDTIVEI